MEEFGKLHNQIPNWAAGYKAAFCGYDDPEQGLNKNM